MQILIVVPAFNEGKSIIDVIRDLKKHGYKNILVVDDGSVDRTGELAKKAKAFVVRHVINRGLGAALGTGFEFAKHKSYSTLVTFDSDGQHKAKDIINILKPIKNNQADVVIGSRLLWNKKNMPLGRLILNHLSNLATFALYGVWATDTLSGLRAFNKKAIRSINIKTQRMEVSNEFFKEIKINNLRFKEIPIRPIYTKYSIKSSSQGQLAPVKLAARMILRLFR